MSMARRKFMQAVGLGAVAGPIAGRQILADGASMAGPAGVATSAGALGKQLGIQATPWHQIAAKAYANDAARKQIESLFYEQNRLIGAIDHDLAAKRSFSLAAKVTFQRQREVERRMSEMVAPWAGDRVNDIIRKVTGLFN